MAEILFRYPGNQPLIPAVIRYHSWNGSVQAAGRASELKVRTLVDTGATYAAATPELIAKLGLESCGQLSHATAVGKSMAECYMAKIGLGEAPGPEMELANVVVAPADLQGFDLIIGREVMKYATWTFYPDNRISMVFDA